MLAQDFDVFYCADLTETVVGTAGSFQAFLDSADAAAWDSARIGTHTLRYLDTANLVTGDALTIDGIAYKVAALPKRINAREFVADLVRA